MLAGLLTMIIGRPSTWNRKMSPCVRAASARKRSGWRRKATRLAGFHGVTVGTRRPRGGAPPRSDRDFGIVIADPTVAPALRGGVAGDDIAVAAPQQPRPPHVQMHEDAVQPPVLAVV